MSDFFYKAVLDTVKVCEYVCAGVCVWVCVCVCVCLYACIQLSMNRYTCMHALYFWFGGWGRCCWSLNSAILHSQADSLHSHVILHEWIAFYSGFRMSTTVVYLQHWHGWCHMKLLPSWSVPCTPYNHAQCHFMQSHKRKVHACLAVTCHLHFWQNDQDLLWVGNDAGWKDGAGVPLVLSTVL